VFKTIGDAFCAAFEQPEEAVAAATEAQRQLQTGEWESGGPLKVRMALHTGPAEFRENDYFGPALNRVARFLQQRTAVRSC
jgi:class 3 adenylate cyclase